MMTRINKEIRHHFDNYNQASFILATQLEKKEELEERIRFMQEKLEEEWSAIIRLEKAANLKTTVKEFFGNLYDRRDYCYSGTCHCDECTCDLKGFKKCVDKYGCRAN